MKDYSKTENFNIAAIDAVIDAITDGYKYEEVISNIIEVVYTYKGRILKAKAEVTLDCGEIRSVTIISVEQVKE